MDTHAHAEGSNHGASVGTNLAVWIGLVAITGLEVFLAYMEWLVPAMIFCICMMFIFFFPEAFRLLQLRPH